jgi:hypothetical protein
MSTLRVDNLNSRTSNKITIPTGTTLYPPGHVVQVKTVNSGFTNQTINSATPVALSGMTVTITPTYATSRILIQAAIAASWTYVASPHIYRNGVDIIAAHGSNSQTGGSTALYTTYFPFATDSTTDSMRIYPLLFDDLPATTSATTYAIYVNSGWSGGTNAFYFNNRASGDMLSCSYMTVMEIAQ